MEEVSYLRQYQYQHSDYPSLPIQICNPSNRENFIDIDAYFDSGAYRSLLDGRLAGIIGLNLFDGARVFYNLTSGNGLEGRLHRVVVLIPGLREIELEVGFSVGDISRNILGRDFFGLTQIGFRQSKLTLYLTDVP